MLFAAGAGVVMAQSGDESGGSSFLDRVAAKLGIGSDELRQAVIDVRKEQIDEAAANGRITGEQAERMKQRLDELPADAPLLAPGPLGGPRGPHGLRGPHGGEFGLEFRMGDGGFHLGFMFPGLDREELRQEIAGFLGITVEELEQELEAEGATLGSVAEAHGKTRDDISAFIIEQVRAGLESAVASGDLDQEKADAILEGIEPMVDRIVDGAWGMPLGGDFRGPPRFREEFREFWEERRLDPEEPEQESAPEGSVAPAAAAARS
jgi:hypothetical protein